MVKSKSRRRKIILILSALLVIYLAGYVFCRLNKSIVHSAAAVGGKCTGHEVTAGDFKMNNMPAFWSGVYTPIRYAELLVWKIVKPDGSNC